jgi:hypothetical protein
MSIKLNADTGKGIGIILAVCIAGLLVYYIIKKFFGGLSDLKQSIGLGDSPEVAQAKQKINETLDKASNPASYWTPEYWNNAPAGARYLPITVAKDCCKKIHDAYGFFSYLDTPEDMEAAFKKCPSKSAVSYLVVEFQIMYNTDLLAYLNRYTDTDKDRLALERAIKYCDSLPAY